MFMLDLCVSCHYVSKIQCHCFHSREQPVSPWSHIVFTHAVRLNQGPTSLDFTVQSLWSTTMRTKSDNGFISANAISGTRVVILGLDVKGYELPEMMSKLSLGESKLGNTKAKKQPLFIGFSISRTDVETGKHLLR